MYRTCKVCGCVSEQKFKFESKERWLSERNKKLKEIKFFEGQKWHRWKVRDQIIFFTCLVCKHVEELVVTRIVIKSNYSVFHNGVIGKWRKMTFPDSWGIKKNQKLNNYNPQDDVFSQEVM